MSCCGVTIEAHRNADLRKTYAPRGRNYTFAGFSPLMQIRDGATVLLTISLSATANGSVFSVVGDALALTLKKADVLALASGPGDRLLSYDIVLSQGGIESWFVGGDFIVLDINATTTEGEQNVSVDLDGQSVDVTIMGGNIGIGASVLLADLNSAVESAEQSADDAAASLAAVPGLATTAGAAAGTTAGATAGTTAGTAAANSVVATKADLAIVGVSVDALGAVGNGVANDAPAFQTALNLIKAAGGGRLILGAKNYLLNSKVSLDLTGVAGGAQPFRLEIEGMGRTQVTCNVAGDFAIEIISYSWGAAAFPMAPKVDGIVFRGVSNSSNKILRLARTGGFHISNCIFAEMLLGLALEDSVAGEISSTKFSYGTNGIYGYASTPDPVLGSSANEIVLTDVQFGAIQLRPIKMDDGVSQLTIVGGSIEGLANFKTHAQAVSDGVYGIELIAPGAYGSLGLTLIGFHAETNNGIALIKIVGGPHGHMHDLSFDSANNGSSLYLENVIEYVQGSQPARFNLQLAHTGVNGYVPSAGRPAIKETGAGVPAIWNDLGCYWGIAAEKPLWGNSGGISTSGEFLGAIRGVSDTSNALAGQVGEYVESSVPFGSAIALTDNTNVNVTSISLTPGDWEVGGVSGFSVVASAGAQVLVDFQAGASSASGAFDSDRHNSRIYNYASTNQAGNANQLFPIPTNRRSFSTPTTFYLVAKSGFGGTGSVSAYGTIWARRMR